MAIKPIVLIPDPILREKSKPLERVDDAVRAFADDMLETMYDAPGIGLAAPQVLEGFAPDGTPRLRPARRPIT